MKIIPQWAKNLYKYGTIKPDIIGQPLNHPNFDEGMCGCGDMAIKVRDGYMIEYAQLKDGCYISFYIGTCKKCGGVIGDDNLKLFLKQGKEPFISDLRRTWNITKEFNSNE